METPTLLVWDNKASRWWNHIVLYSKYRFDNSGYTAGSFAVAYVRFDLVNPVNPITCAI